KAAEYSIRRAVISEVTVFADALTNGRRRPPGGSCRPLDYQSLVEEVHQTALRVLPRDAMVAIVSRGDDQLLKLNGRVTWHFPRDENGVYLGYHPANSEGAIAHLEALSAKGLQFLLFPGTALWWLDHYSEFREYLEMRHRRVYTDPRCVIYCLE